MYDLTQNIRETQAELARIAVRYHASEEIKKAPTEIDLLRYQYTITGSDQRIATGWGCLPHLAMIDCLINFHRQVKRGVIPTLPHK